LIPLAPGSFKVYGSGQVTLGVEDHSLADLVSVYPNPVENEFKINATANKVDIFDLSGRLIKSFKGNFSENSSYDIKDLKPSIYLIRIKADHGILTKKIIKN
ncbi:MAG: T9SS type A sorting domain-containing protein, partial [Aureibaculum sp.]